MKLPRLRAVELIPYQDNQNKGYILNDPLRLSGRSLFIPEPVAFIIAHFDGEKSFADLQENFYRRFGEILFREKVQEIISTLDENYLLENERFQKKMEEEKDAFASSPVREPYSLRLTPQQADTLKRRIQQAVSSFPPEKPSSAIVSPHIDYERGMEAYARCYACYRELEGKTLIILGTNHTPFGDDFILTRKSFLTPWARIDVNTEILEQLEQALDDPYRDEIAHRFEHSIELNVAFLSALTSNFKIVPLLAPSFSRHIEERRFPIEYEGFFAKLKEVSSPPDVLLVAAVDLSHVGLRFGTGVEASKIMAGVENFDRRLIDHILKGDPLGFLREFFPNGNATNVCGTGPLYTLLKVVEGPGRLLGYYRAMDPDGSSAVTFAALLF